MDQGILKTVQQKLSQIEKDHVVTILYAVESGSMLQVLSKDELEYYHCCFGD